MTIPSLNVVHLAEARAFLAALPDDSIDALITDPPYSSGGMFRGDRNAVTSTKYSRGGDALGRGAGRDFPEFEGDTRDGRSWAAWLSFVLADGHRVLRAGSYVCLFTDWRMLPSATDALQAGGFVWRGVIAWDKGRGSRAPHTGYARHQCEFVIWGSKGALGPADGRGPFDGCISEPVRQIDKHHMTGKPTEVMRRLVRMPSPNALILDPFAGSGTTGVACVIEGRRFLGCEMSAEYVEIANARIAETVTPPILGARQGDLLGGAA